MNKSTLATSRPFDFVRDALKGQTIRVAVCGTENSGKTVFLASLASHFEFHDPGRDENAKDDVRFDFGDGRMARRFKLLTGNHGSPDDALGDFPYREAQSAFWTGESWPAATARPSELAFSFDLRWPNATGPMISRWSRNSRKSHRVTMRFLDVPGERMADFAMYGTKFDEWADDFLDKHADAVLAYKRWLDDQERKARDGETIDFDEDIVCHQYGETLATAFNEKHIRFLSPSSVRVSEGGTVYPNDNSPFENGIEHRLGIDASRRFVPLSRFWREKKPELARKFSKNFETYKHKLVNPVVDWMKQAHCALFLVDMFAALNRGEEAYEATQKEFESMLCSLRNPKASLGTWIKNGIFRERVDKDRVRIVVTKIDRADSDESRTNLVAQAKRMLGTIVRDIFDIGDKAESAVFTSCSAAVTQSNQTSPKTLCSIPSEGEELNFENLRGSMNEKEANPPNFKTPKKRGPRHSGLDRIARFLLGLKEEIS